MPKYVKLRSELAAALIDAFKRFDIEIHALRQTLGSFKDLFLQFPEIAQALQVRGITADFLDESLVAARQDSSLLELMTQKYDAILETLHAEVIDAEAQKKIDQLIAQLRPTDLLN